MLSIHEGFPIKKVAMYGSAAFIVGFTGTLAMLREYVPKSDSGIISVVDPSNRQQVGNVSNQLPKDSTKGKTTDPAAPLVQGAPTTANGSLSTRQASPIPIASSTTPSSRSISAAPAPSPAATTTPSVAVSPQPTTSGQSTSPATATQQPAPTAPADPALTSGLQQTVTDINKTTTSLLP